MKLPKILQAILCITLSISMTGCASMFHGSSQQINIRSNDPDTKLYVNEAYAGKGATVTSFEKNKTYALKGEKEGCITATALPTKSFDAVSLLCIFGGLLGIVLGLVIDGAVTGAAGQYGQTSYVLDPDCSKAKNETVSAVPASTVVPATAPATNGNGGSVNTK